MATVLWRSGQKDPIQIGRNDELSHDLLAGRHDHDDRH